MHYDPFYTKNINIYGYMYTFSLGLWKEKVSGRLDVKMWIIICGWRSYQSVFSKTSSRNIDLRKARYDLKSGSAIGLPPWFWIQQAMSGLRPAMHCISSPHSRMCPLPFLSQTKFLWPTMCLSLPAFSSKQILTLREGGVPY